MSDSLTVQAHEEQSGIMLTAHDTETPEYKRLEPNKYPARLVNITKHDGPYGTSLKITFEIVQGDEYVRLTTFTSLSLFVGSEKRPPSKLCQLFYAIEKRLPETGENIDVMSLQGKYCLITVSDTPGKKYQAIKDFQPAESNSGFKD